MLTPHHTTPRRLLKKLTNLHCPPLPSPPLPSQPLPTPPVLRYTPIPLSDDHKPDRPDEKKRIQESGGQVGCRQIVVGHSATGPVMLPMGPARVWYSNRGDTMGLAMSRSLGDAIVHTVGVSSEPEVRVHEAEDDDEFLIMGTDGVWDVIDNAQAVEIVQNHIARQGAGWVPEECASLIARSARRRWANLSSMIDDITCLVIKLH